MSIHAKSYSRSKNTQGWQQRIREKEPIRRKTDGFQALVHALYRADDLKDSNLEEEINLLRGLRF